MFHKEFYPTPFNVMQMMGIDCKNRIVLEPHAGKGDLVDYCKINGAKDVVAFEVNKDLQKIVSSKCQLLGEDFFNCTPEHVSHVQLIVMNPPFSNADKHILHAWAVAAEGCEIISLCNWQTIEKDYRYSELNRLIADYGTSENLENCFDTAERKTNVNVGLIKLHKPLVNAEGTFEGFFLDDEEEERNDVEGVMQYNEVRALVGRHIQAMKTFNILKENMDALNYVLSPIGLSKLELNAGYDKTITTKEQFSKVIQKRSWEYIFGKMNMQKYVTTGVMRDINRFVETQTKVPFTMRNIYKMFEIIVGTREETFKRALEEAIDNFTKHTHENRFAVEGWKTNAGHMLNKKFIVNWMCEPKYNSDKVSLRYSNNSEQLKDLIKVICNITGDNYIDHTTLREFFNRFDGLETNRWYHWSFFEIKVFKKGTMHLKFQNVDTWYQINQAYAALKGFKLPETYNR